MSNVIDFLERMGQDASLRQANSSDVEKALVSAAISPELRAAIVASDSKELESLLGAETNVCCMIQPVTDDEDGVEKRNRAMSLMSSSNKVA